MVTSDVLNIKKKKNRNCISFISWPVTCTLRPYSQRKYFYAARISPANNTMIYKLVQTTFLASAILSSVCHATRPGSGQGFGSGSGSGSGRGSGPGGSSNSDRWYRSLVAQAQDNVAKICPPCIDLASNPITYNPTEILAQQRTNNFYVRTYTRVVRLQYLPKLGVIALKRITLMNEQMENSLERFGGGPIPEERREVSTILHFLKLFSCRAFYSLSLSKYSLLLSIPPLLQSNCFWFTVILI